VDLFESSGNILQVSEGSFTFMLFGTLDDGQISESNTSKCLNVMYQYQNAI
jgi:hypothetical protein